MPNFFPQLSSGASAQFPIVKSRFIRTIQNVMADGSFYSATDPGAGRLQWQFSYSDLSFADVTALQEFFDTCAGPVQPFTFIDPTGNMLVESIDFALTPWQPMNGLISFEPGVADPFGGTGAFTATNQSQIAQEISQSLTVLANDQYCFSVYASSGLPATITLTRVGTSPGQTITYNIGPEWTRLVSSGRLSNPDEGTELAVAIGLARSQVVSLYGPQLEAQLAPSRYRSTTSVGAVYSNAHWAVEELPIVAQAPNLYSVSFTIEAALQG
jgi:hypothetical protein